MISQKLFWEPVVFHSKNMWNHLYLYVHNLSSKGVTWSSFKFFSFLLWLRRVYRAVQCVLTITNSTEVRSVIVDIIYLWFV
jgi:hypothetical protein